MKEPTRREHCLEGTFVNTLAAAQDSSFGTEADGVQHCCAMQPVRVTSAEDFLRRREYCPAGWKGKIGDVVDVREFHVISALMQGQSDLLSTSHQTQWGECSLFDLLLRFAKFDTAEALLAANVEHCEVKHHHVAPTVSKCSSGRRWGSGRRCPTCSCLCTQQDSCSHCLRGMLEEDEKSGTWMPDWASCLQEAVANAQLPVVEWLMTLRCKGYRDAPVNCDALAWTRLIDIYTLCSPPGLKWNSWPWYWICRYNSAPKRLWMAQDLLFWRRTGSEILALRGPLRDGLPGVPFNPALLRLRLDDPHRRSRTVADALIWAMTVGGFNEEVCDSAVHYIFHSFEDQEFPGSWPAYLGNSYISGKGFDVQRLQMAKDRGVCLNRICFFHHCGNDAGQEGIIAISPLEVALNIGHAKAAELFASQFLQVLGSEVQEEPPTACWALPNARRGCWERLFGNIEDLALADSGLRKAAAVAAWSRVLQFPRLSDPIVRRILEFLIRTE